MTTREIIQELEKSCLQIEHSIAEEESQSYDEQEREEALEADKKMLEALRAAIEVVRKKDLVPEAVSKKVSCFEEIAEDDLISRKAVFKAFSDYINKSVLGETSSRTELSIGEIASVIRSVASAFNKEKVTKELVEWAEDAEKWTSIYKAVGDNTSENMQEIAAICYRNAIEIVEKGGSL